MSLNGVHHIAQHNVKAVRENRKRFIHVLRWAVRNFRGYFNADSESDGFPVNTEQMLKQRVDLLSRFLFRGHLDLQLWGRAEPNSSWASQFTGLVFVLVSDIGFLHSASLDR
jgi:hypothetical protein